MKDEVIWKHWHMEQVHQILLLFYSWN